MKQEIRQDRWKPSYQKLKTMVRRHIDQMIWTRNFKVRNARVETGVLIKTQDGQMSALKGKHEIVMKGKQRNSVDACSFRHDDSKCGKKTQSSSLTPRPQTQSDLRKEVLPEAAAHLERDFENRADITSKETVLLRHVIIGILPYVKNFKIDSGCKFGEKCELRHTEVDSQPRKEAEEKWLQKIYSLFEEFEANGLRVPR